MQLNGQNILQQFGNTEYTSTRVQSLDSTANFGSPWRQTERSNIQEPEVAHWRILHPEVHRHVQQYIQNVPSDISDVFSLNPSEIASRLGSSTSRKPLIQGPI